MKKNYILIFSLILFLSSGKLIAQTEWTGPLTTFSKQNFADWTLEANQDRITSNVWITRANNQGIFNIVTESAAGGTDVNGPSPADTEWAFGTISGGVNFLTFTTWGIAHGGNPPGLVSQDMVVHLITDDIYIDIKFLSWSSGGSGGGFSYNRTTDQNLSTNEYKIDTKIKLFPNPSSDFIRISGITKTENYSIYNILGAKVKSGTILNGEKIDIRNVKKGLFFLKFESGEFMKFIKK